MDFFEKYADTYEMRGILGSGKGGTVYKVFHKRLQTDIVLKKIHTNVISSKDYRREVDIIKNLNHPYLPRVYDFYTEGQDIYTAMNFIPGQSFKEVLERRRVFSEDDYIRWGVQLTDALAHLHGMRPPIIHSDIKPGNIMLKPNGDICLIDFNISFFLDGSAVLGFTRGFSSPEQYDIVQRSKTPNYRGRFFGMDGRSDIYSAAATLYTIITGRKIGAFGEPIDRELVAERAGETYADILEKALNIDPEERFQSAREMNQAFRNIRQNDERAAALVRKKKRRRILILLLILAAAAAAVSFGIVRMDSAKTERYESLVQEIAFAGDGTDYDKTEEMFDEAVSLRPERSEAYVFMAEDYVSWKQYETGRDFITKNIISNNKLELDQTQTIAVYAALAECELNCQSDDNSNYVSAVETYEKLLEMNPDEPEYLIGLAQGLAHTGKEDEALQKVSEAEALDTQKKLADKCSYARAEINECAGDKDEAVKYYEEAARETMDDSIRTTAALKAASLYSEEGNYLEATEFLRDIYPDIAQKDQEKVLSVLVDQDIYLVNSDSDKTDYMVSAIEDLQTVIKNGWDDERTYDNLIVMAIRVRDFDFAELYLEEMKEKYPDSYRVSKLYAYKELMQQKEKSSGASYKKFAEYLNEAKQQYIVEGGSGDKIMDWLEDEYNTLYKEGKLSS